MVDIKQQTYHYLKKKLTDTQALTGAQLRSINDNSGSATDCFKESIQVLNDMEASLGFSLPQDDATTVLNDAYANCFCLTNLSKHHYLDIFRLINLFKRKDNILPFKCI